MITIRQDFNSAEQFKNIPPELVQLPQWITRKGKIPFNPVSGMAAKAGEPSTWGSFSQAFGAYAKGGYDGIGFEFHNNNIVGVDLDHVLDPKTGTLREDARRVVDELDSYTEISPSGTGLHIIAFGRLPVKGRKHSELGFEMYQAARYFTITGNVFEGRRTIQHREKQLTALFNRLFPKEEVKPQGNRSPSVMPQNLLAVGLERDKTLAEYWNGRRDSGDESSNDIAFMNKLAYWCNKDIDQMTAAFDASPYAAQKDSKHLKKMERADYLRRTAERACRDCQRTAAEDSRQYRQERAQRRAESTFADFTPKGIQFINPLETKETRSRYTYDDIGMSRLFADTFRDILRYIVEYKRWFIYLDGVWRDEEVIADIYAKMLADYVWSIVPPPPPVAKPSEEAAPDEWKDARKHYEKYRAFKWRETLLKDSRAELRGKAADFDSQPMLFNCLNGTLDLQTLQLRPHDPDDFISKRAEVGYDPKARCERFERFIAEITEGNQDRARMLQKSLGYALKGEANEECYFNAVGEKTRNGKGTLFDTVLQLFGSYGAQVDFNTFARTSNKDGSKPTPDLARLRGVRLAVANEPDKGVFVNEALLKQVTGNDDLVARALHSAPIQFKPVFKLFITANSRPNVTDDSLFASDRVKVLPFTHHFTAAERDTSLKSKLRTPEALSGILNWLLDGYALYVTEGLQDTDEMRQLVESYRRENDYIGQYIDECLVFNNGGPNGRTPLKAVRLDYERWCNEIGVKPLGLKMFKADLERRGVHVYEYCKQAHINAKYRHSDDFTECNRPP